MTRLHPSTRRSSSDATPARRRILPAISRLRPDRGERSSATDHAARIDARATWAVRGPLT